MTATSGQTFRPPCGMIGERSKEDRKRSIIGSDIHRKRTKRRLSMTVMAIGYLGLVALLAMAPALHQTIASPASHILACTDFGGSR